MGLLTNLGFAYQFMQHGVALKFVVFGLFSSLLTCLCLQVLLLNCIPVIVLWKSFPLVGFVKGFLPAGLIRCLSLRGIAGLLNNFLLVDN